MTEYDQLKVHYDRLKSAEERLYARGQPAAIPATGSTAFTEGDKVTEPKDLSKELWREYEFGGRVYRINSPQSLWIGTTTHRVLDGGGVVHCCPSPGQGDCVLRWMPRNSGEPVQF